MNKQVVNLFQSVFGACWSGCLKKGGERNAFWEANLWSFIMNSATNKKGGIP
jgi:hypothetical protein